MPIILSLYCSHQSISSILPPLIGRTFSNSNPLRDTKPNLHELRIPSIKINQNPYPNQLKNELMLLKIANSGYYYLINWLSEDGYSTPIWAVLIAGTFVVVTLTLSIYLMFEHLSAYKNPEVQFTPFLITSSPRIFFFFLLLVI